MAVLIVLNYVLQSTVLSRFVIFGVQPDTALVFIVSYGLLRGDVEGAIFGFFAGLMHDVTGGTVIGLYAMLGMVTGYFAGKPFKDYFHNNVFLPLALVVVATLVYQFVYYFLVFLFQGRVALGLYFQEIILPKTIYTAILAVPLYSLLFWINAKITRWESFNRKLFKKA